MTSHRPAVVLLSGGIDSSTALAIARAEGFSPHALTLRYGQRHAIEIKAATRIAKDLGARKHVILDLDLRTFGGSALTDEIPVPRGKVSDEIPVTYVPARNTIFLSVALAWAEVLGSENIYIGVNALDYSGYPDCRPEYIAAYQQMARLATRAGVEGEQLVTIRTPLIDLSKREIIARGLELGVDYSLTVSCYDPSPSGKPCGTCDSCRLRVKGFAELGIPDPALKPTTATPAVRARR